IGACTNDWVQVFDTDSISAFSGTSGSPSLLSNRISFVFGLSGPSMTIDTACSSALSALDVCVNKMVNGEVSTCLVGGVNLMLIPDIFIAFSKARMLARDARCKTFDHRADGYGRGEGAA